MVYTLQDPKRKARSHWPTALVTSVVLAGLLFMWGSHRTSTGQAEGDGLIGTATTQPSAGGQTLRVGTFNIRGGVGADDKFDLDRTASVIAGFDFLGLNEVQGRSLWGRPDEAEILGGKIGLPQRFFPSEHQWWHDHWGNAVLSDLPVGHWVRFPFAKTKPDGHRSVVLLDAQWNDRTIHFIVTHTDGSEDRDGQLRVLKQLFFMTAEPVIILGDFNTTSDQPVLHNMLDGHDVVDPVARMMLNQQPKDRIDWILARGFEIVDGGVKDIGASDHPFYWAELKYAGGGSR